MAPPSAFNRETPINVLLVEDNPGDVDLVNEYVGHVATFRVAIDQVDRISSALEKLRTSNYDVILLDLSLPDAMGFEGLAMIRKVETDLPIVVLTSTADEKLALSALKQGAQDYLVKGHLSARELARSLAFAVERQQYYVRLRQFADSESKARLSAENVRVELETAKSAAEAANISKSMFLANMSHEIRTPLGVIMGFSDLAARSDQTAEERQSSLERIHRNAVQLSALVDDILDLSKVEADRFEPEIMDFALGPFLAEIVENYALKAHEKGLKISA